jgi:hypothetical protein
VETEQNFPLNVCVDGTSSALGDGKRNTQRIVEKLREAKIGGAAQYCDDLEYGGYTDWFLPSKDELNLMYWNLKEKGLGGFASASYWSSFMRSVFASPCFQRFDNGGQGEVRESTSLRVRAVRQF